MSFRLAVLLAALFTSCASDGEITMSSDKGHNQQSIIWGSCSIDKRFDYSFSIANDTAVVARWPVGEPEKSKQAIGSPVRLLALSRQLLKASDQSRPPFPPGSIQIQLKTSDGRMSYFNQHPPSPLYLELLNELKTSFRK
jgi:hypothetical protein